jgi:autoinducer 2-degrading protein
MYVVSVTVFVTPGFADQFIAAVLDNARNTRHEPGNLRFDVCQAEDDPNRFLLYEVYKEKEDFTRHQQTPHYARFRDAVAPWMAQPRQGVKHLPLFYGESEVR